MSRAVPVLVTGTWGVGKTALIDRLAVDVSVVSEPARIALAEDPRIGDDSGTFTRALLERSLADFASVGPGITVFDRGVPDCLAYARWFGLDTADYESAAARNRYHEGALFCPAWAEIFVNDDLRKATFEMASEFQMTLMSTYEDLGYRLVSVPLTNVDEREEFVRAFLNGVA